eukprot:RCo029417
MGKPTNTAQQLEGHRVFGSLCLTLSCCCCSLRLHLISTASFLAHVSAHLLYRSLLLSFSFSVTYLRRTPSLRRTCSAAVPKTAFPWCKLSVVRGRAMDFGDGLCAGLLRRFSL